MSTIKLKIVLILLNVLLISNSYAQKDKVDSVQIGSKQNVVSLILGTPGLYGIVNGNYERISSH